MLLSAMTSLPRLSVTPQSLIVRQATTVALTCALQPPDSDAESVTLSDVRWKLDENELETGRGHVTLIINDFDKTTHGGVYQCSAELAGVGHAVSDDATIRAAGTRHDTSNRNMYRSHRMYGFNSDNL